MIYLLIALISVEYMVTIPFLKKIYISRKKYTEREGAGGGEGNLLNSVLEFDYQRPSQQ